MHFADLNWMQVEEYLKKEDRLILVLGATEQHAYLSLTTDVQIPLKLGEAAGKKSGVLVAPPLNFGSSPYFLSYPGTLSLKIETLLRVVEDIIHSAYGQGFRRFLILNGHGGNAPVRGLLYELANQLPEMQARFYSWWQSPVVAEFANKYSLKQAHANWEEAFPFTRVTEDMPKEEKEFPQSRSIVNADEQRKIYGDGSLGGKYLVSDEIMEELFQVCLSEVLDHLKFEND